MNQLIQIRFAPGGRLYTYAVPLHIAPVAVGDEVEVPVGNGYRRTETVERVNVPRPNRIVVKYIDCVRQRTPLPPKPVRLTPAVPFEGRLFFTIADDDGTYHLHGIVVAPASVKTYKHGYKLLDEILNSVRQADDWNYDDYITALQTAGWTYIYSGEWVRGQQGL